MLLPLNTASKWQRMIRVSRGATRWAWTAVALNCMTIVWMIAAGPWLDKQHNLLSMVTWNGHHWVLIAGAACSARRFGRHRPLTRGFSEGPMVLFAVVIGAGFVLDHGRGWRAGAWCRWSCLASSSVCWAACCAEIGAGAAGRISDGPATRPRRAVPSPGRARC